MDRSVAIVGMACCFPDARSPVELWENVLAQRRAFRRLPPERLPLEDYYSPDPQAPDRFYATEAALIDGYEFDRLRYRVVGSTYRSADMAHWLALDVAASALEDAGFPDGAGLPRETTTVILGNTLTGEFSRANTLRLRWPYVRRVVQTGLRQREWSSEDCDRFLADLEEAYKEPFPPVGDESLAGGLANTIAGRICNHFDFKGGGYIVDGACASSLLSVAHAASAVLNGDADVALAGGVDLSIDPFELVGFAKLGALALEDMRVYDARSAGFWPGEGCGVIVLMRLEDALAQDKRIYARIRGWGISSDGSGGITRPEAEGQMLALKRAYRRAGFGIEDVAYFEGHGTGTSVGDAIELQVLSEARRKSAPRAAPAAIGSIKANIGHTKAAAGVAGLIKATMAVHEQVLPPTTGCGVPHEQFTAEAAMLRVLKDAEPWPVDAPLRVGISAMGFGGINTHIVLEGTARERRRTLDHRVQELSRSCQDTELFLLSAPDRAQLREQLDQLVPLAARLARAELGDLAQTLARGLNGPSTRAAVVACSPAQLAERFKKLRDRLDESSSTIIDLPAGVFLGSAPRTARVGFLFPGQGAPAHLDGGAMCRRFQSVGALYNRASLPIGGDSVATEVAQPAIVTASAAALEILERLGITASVAIGHSLGELSAWHWAGAMDAEALIRLATARGRVMAELGSPTGTMAGIRADHRQVASLLQDDDVVIAGLNSPHQTVISGPARAVEDVVERAKAQGLAATKLAVSHAFHSSLVAAAAPALGEYLARETFRPLRRTVASTITGGLLPADQDLSALLCRQVTSPVRFMDAVSAVASDLDLLIEVGPGEVLAGLVADFAGVPAVSIDAGGPSLAGLLNAVAAAFVAGADVNAEALFEDRFTRPFDLDRRPTFFVNPCERTALAKRSNSEEIPQPLPQSFAVEQQVYSEPLQAESAGAIAANPLELVRQLVSDRAELPPSAVGDDSRMLGDLHLNSISVGQIVVEATRRLGLPAPVDPTAYANATVAEIGQALATQTAQGESAAIGQRERLPAGVDSWIRAFTIELVERPLTRRPQAPKTNGWQVLASPDHPLKAPLAEVFARSSCGGGVVVCLPADPNERQVGLLLDGVRAALADRNECRFVMVQQGGGAAALAKTLHLEQPGVEVCVVDVPFDHPQAADWVLTEAANVMGYSEAYYDASGRRRVPVLKVLADECEPTEWPLGPDDVLLVAGGGKGIAAHCAIAMALETGVRLALLGRSRPNGSDRELTENLDQLSSAGLEFRYIPTDVTDAAQVQRAVQQVESELGPVTAFWHAAGVNAPQLLDTLDEPAFRRTLAPKVQGAENVLAALDADRLKLFVSFGSLIAPAGMSGEADYAVANEWLARLTERWQEAHPHCKCLAIEWSVWASVGMGRRLGRVETLMQQGVTPIPTDEGLRWFRRLICRTLPAVRIVVAGRFGEPPTLRLHDEELPLHRFLELPRVHYPGVELVVDAELSVDSDPYVNDHVLKGERLFPAVMALEAMAQAASALAHSTAPPVFTNVCFERSVVVPEDQSVTIRIAALHRSGGQIDVVLRSSMTGFQVDHFRATCSFGAEAVDSSAVSMPPWANGQASVTVDPQHDLYGRILFHTGRFRRLRGYQRLLARECVAEISGEHRGDWFGRYLPSGLILGDPGSRDAAIHAIQACIPHARLLPVGVDRIVPRDHGAGCGPLLMRAVETGRAGDTFIYDMEFRDLQGQVVEQWFGLRLKVLEPLVSDGGWPAALLGPYVERRVNELVCGAGVSVVVERNGEQDRRQRSDHAIGMVSGSSAPLRRRGDGKPEVADPGVPAVSASHAGDLTLAVAGCGPIGCDVEPVAVRALSVWRDLLGPERFALVERIAAQRGEELNTAATRVWSAGECLKKAGTALGAPLVLAESTPDGWVLLQSGDLLTATYVASIRNMPDELVVSVLGSRDAQGI